MQFNLMREMASRHRHGNTPMVNRRLEMAEGAEQAGDSDLDVAALVLAASRMAKA